MGKSFLYISPYTEETTKGIINDVVVTNWGVYGKDYSGYTPIIKIVSVQSYDLDEVVILEEKEG